jgi:hypothetical protein
MAHKILLALGDTHVGNDGAVMPEEVNTEDHCPGKNRRHFATEIQKKIIKRWYDMCDEVKNPDILLLNGDLVDGRNYKGSGMGTWTTDVNLQAKVLSELVKMIKPRKIIATSGSPYHCDHNPNMDAIAVEKCGGTFQGGYATISIGEHRVYAQHKVSVSKVWQYRTNGIARALVMATLNEPEYGHYDVLLKSHAHYFTYAGFTSSLGMVLPCWKAHDEFGDTNVEFANPALGYVKFDFEDSDYSFNHSIFHFKQRDIVPDVVA